MPSSCRFNRRCSRPASNTRRCPWPVASRARAFSARSASRQPGHSPAVSVGALARVVLQSHVARLSELLHDEIAGVGLYDALDRAVFMARHQDEVVTLGTDVLVF